MYTIHYTLLIKITFTFYSNKLLTVNILYCKWELGWVDFDEKSIKIRSVVWEICTLVLS